MWGDGGQLLLDGIADIECLDEGSNGVGRDTFVGTGELLQRLVGIGIALATKDGLDGLGNDRPGIVEVVNKLLLVEDELSQTLQRALEGNDAVSEGHTDVADDGAVGEVALQTADGQLLCQEGKDGVSDAEVAF